MNAATKNHVIELLEGYQSRAQKIDLLHYKLSHPSNISGEEMIEAMSLAHGEGDGMRSGHISDKTLYIALNYQKHADKVNMDAMTEISERLVALEKEQDALKHCISLLEPRLEQVITLTYIKRLPAKEVEQYMGFSAKTVRKLKGDAINRLAEMFDFLEGE